MRSVTVQIDGLIRSWARTADYKGRRLAPKAQRAYQQMAAFAALDARPVGWPLDRRYTVRIDVHCDGRKRDADNAGKTICDAMQDVLWLDDSQIDDLRVRMHRRSKPYHVVVYAEVLDG